MLQLVTVIPKTKENWRTLRCSTWAGRPARAADTSRASAILSRLRQTSDAHEILQLGYHTKPSGQGQEKPRTPIAALRGTWWKPPHLCGGRSASALRQRVGTLIMHLSAGNAKDERSLRENQIQGIFPATNSGASYPRPFFLQMEKPRLKGGHGFTGCHWPIQVAAGTPPNSAAFALKKSSRVCARLPVTVRMLSVTPRASSLRLSVDRK